VAVVTISASYGAGGSVIGPQVADALGLPFVDRAIPVSVADRLGVPPRAAEGAEESAENSLWRALSSMALVPDLAGAGALAYVPVPDEDAFRAQTERVLREIAATTGGVILGRAAALVLADTPGALHVRLDGPAEGRVDNAVKEFGLTPAQARAILRKTDAARHGYVRHYYRRDPTDPRMYHLVVDTTAVPWPAAVELVVRAARACGVSALPPAPG
jgi:cytidylate kinase